MQTDNRAEQCAKACLKNIQDMFRRLDESDSDETLQESIEQEIDETAYGAHVEKQYIIELAGGGPAVRITGTLDEHDEPETAVLQYQDWFTPWETYRIVDETLLLRFAQRYYFGS